MAKVSNSTNSENIKDFTLACEANIVSCLWKEPELFFTYSNLKLDDFNHNVWKVYWTIGKEIVTKEEKPVLDDVTVGLYLEKHPKLKDKYEEYGGFDTIENAKEYVKVQNTEGYIKELYKWNTVAKLGLKGFPIKGRMKEFADMTVQEIYDDYEVLINHIFANVETDLKSYNLCDDLYGLIDELNAGKSVGLPFWNSPILNKETGGNLVGNITLLGGLSGEGKSTTSMELVLPSILDKNEKIVIMINEEDESKWRREMLVWVANNVFKEELRKHVIRDGGFDKETMDLLRRCADWLEEKKDNKNITLIPFQRYSTSLAVKVIKKYARLGVKYFLLDTFKADADSNTSEQQWLTMQQNMVHLYDTIKEKSENVHLLATFQLGKQSIKQRHYTQDNVGLAKNIVDVGSTAIMIRRMHEDEYPDGKNELKVYKLEGKDKKTKIPIKLSSDKRHILLFIVKNRFGSTNEYQIVVENDLSRNVYKEVGITSVPLDW